MSKYYFIILMFINSLLFGKVYDCFMYFNEADVLEVRLNELYDYVDYFVLVESSEAHRKGQKKPFYFEKDKERFHKFLDKIIHVKLDEHIESDNGWVRENWQRNQIMRGLVNCDEEDLIFISDADEFIPGEIIDHVYNEIKIFPLIGFMHTMYRWKFNRSARMKWAGSAALQYKTLVKMSPQEVRNCVRSCTCGVNIRDCGWHFSSLVRSYEQAKEKYYNIVEGYDYDRFISEEQMNAQKNDHPLIDIDYTFPKYIQENIEYFHNMGLIELIH